MDADPFGVCVLSDTLVKIAKLFYPGNACQAGRCTINTPDLRFSDASSLSDLTKSAAKSGKTAHFSPYFCANRTTIRLKSVKNCARLPLFSL